MVKLKATIIVVYEADSMHYGDTDNPQEMASIDQQSYDEHDISVEDILSWAESTTVVITPGEE
jgi:hypothetical protein